MRAEAAKVWPGMRTLIALAISVAYFSSVAVVLGVQGDALVWEARHVIDIMPLGTWLETKSVMAPPGRCGRSSNCSPRRRTAWWGDSVVVDVPKRSLQPGRPRAGQAGRAAADGRGDRGGQDDEMASMLTGETKPAPRGPRGSGNRRIRQSGRRDRRSRWNRIGVETYLFEVIDMVSQGAGVALAHAGHCYRAALGPALLAHRRRARDVHPLGCRWARDFAFAVERMVAVMMISCRTRSAWPSRCGRP